MPITDLPVLPASYPLFSWDDWPASYAALVPGGPTKAFEKACWNAIVEYVENVTEASGLDWWSDVYTADLIKMLTDGNVRLQAGHMNNIRMAVDNMITLSWRWEYDKSFRGYLGRAYFNNSVNAKQDIVYPEYFLELVKHINKVVEILRGTSDIEASADVLQWSFSQQQLQAERLRSGNVMPWNRTSRTSISLLPESVTLGDIVEFPKHISSTSVQTPDWLIGALIQKYLRLSSWTSVKGERKRAKPTSAKLLMSSLQYAELDYLTKVLEMSAQLWMQSDAIASMETAPAAGISAQAWSGFTASAVLQQSSPHDIVPEGVLSFFLVNNPELDQILPYEITSVRHLAVSSQQAAADKLPSLPVSVMGTSGSSQDAEALMKPSLPIYADQKSESRSQVHGIAAPSAPIRAEVPAKIRTQNPVLNYRTAPVFTEAKAASRASCAIYLYNGWDYPEWVDGGLWIKQAFAIKRIGIRELEVR